MESYQIVLSHAKHVTFFQHLKGYKLVIKIRREAGQNVSVGGWIAIAGSRLWWTEGKHDCGYLPVASSSWLTMPPRSGSSPYQKIQSSLAAASESGGWAGGAGCGRPSGSNSGGCEGALTRRHTHRMSPARQREYEDSTGSSRGSTPGPPSDSLHTSLRHLIPHSSVWNITRTLASKIHRNKNNWYISIFDADMLCSSSSIIYNCSLHYLL